MTLELDPEQGNVVAKEAIVTFKNLKEAIIANNGSGIYLVKVKGISLIHLFSLVAVLEFVKKEFPEIILELGIPRQNIYKDIYADALKHCSFLNKVHDFKKISKDYNFIVDCTTVCIQEEMFVDSPLTRENKYMHYLGFSFEEKPKFVWKSLPKEPKVTASLSNRKVIFIQASSSSSLSDWDIQKVDDLIERHPDIDWVLVDYNRKTRRWNKYKNVINASKIRFRSMVNLLSKCDYFIGIDNEFSYLAQQFGIPGVTLLKPKSNFHNYLIPNKNIQVITVNDCKCKLYQPCNRDQDCIKSIPLDTLNKCIEEFKVSTSE